MALSDPKFPKALEGEGAAMVASPWDSLFSWPFPPGMVGFRSSYHCAELPFRPAKMWKMQHFPREIAYLEFCGYHSSLLVKLGTVWTEVEVLVPHKMKPWKEKRGFNLLIWRALWHRFTSRWFLYCHLPKANNVVPGGEGTKRFRHPGDRTGPVHLFLSANTTEQKLYHEEASAARWESFSFGFHALLCSLLSPTLVFARLPTQGGNICFGWDPLFENVFLKQKQMLNILLANIPF